MNIVQAVILAIVEGVTEFLPVSSTGHLILTAKLLQISTTEFTKSFEIIIQLGAMMAVVSLYWKHILQKPQLAKPILIACLPTGVFGLLFYNIIKRYLLDNDFLVIASLAGVGLILIALEYYWKSRPPTSNKTALTLSPVNLMVIGIFQSLAMVPGVSRSGATIIGGMFMGLSRTEAVEFSFLLAVPTLAAATGLDLIKNITLFNQENVLLLVVGLAVSWIVAAIVIKTFLSLVKKMTFTGFGLYRIAIAFFYWLILLK